MARQINGSTAKLIIRQKVKTAISVLTEAIEYSLETNRDRWEFAVEIARLQESGLCTNDLRWLVNMGFVQHAREVTIEGDNGRQFRPTGNLTFCDHSCFVLTDQGIACFHEAAGTGVFQFDEQQRAAQTDYPSASTVESLQPVWDGERRQLRLNGRIVKCFKWRAVNQEIVLASFQEEGWPPVIDDPLPPQPEQDSKRRLNDTIKALNRGQANKMMKFHGNGTGEGVRWEAIASMSTWNHPQP